MLFDEPTALEAYIMKTKDKYVIKCNLTGNLLQMNKMICYIYIPCPLQRELR